MGINTIDCEYAEKLGIAIRNLGAHSTEDVANHTIALLLALNQNSLFIVNTLKLVLELSKAGEVKRLSS